MTVPTPITSTTTGDPIRSKNDISSKTQDCHVSHSNIPSTNAAANVAPSYKELNIALQNVLRQQNALLQEQERIMLLRGEMQMSVWAQLLEQQQSFAATRAGGGHHMPNRLVAAPNAYLAPSLRLTADVSKVSYLRY